MNTSPINFRINFHLLAGLALISIGILSNEWILAKVFSEDATLAAYSRYLIWVFDLILIFGGSILITEDNWNVLRWTGVAIVSVAVISLLVGYILRMGYSFQIDYNEGWNVYHSVEIISGQKLYTDRLALDPVNYPPLSFYVVGSVGKLLRNPLLAGRLISLLSVLFISLGSGVIVRQLAGNKFAAVFAGVFCLGIFVTYARGYTAMNDPQMLGQAIIMTGLIIYLRNRSRLFIVAFLCSLGIFTKHNLLAVPLAISIDILLRSRKDFFKWIMVSAAISGGLLAMTIFALGPLFIYQLMAPRDFDPERIITWITRLGPAIFFSLLLTVPWLIQAMKKEISRIIPLYLAISILWGLFTSGGAGTDINIFFDFFIGLSIAMGMALSHIRTKFEHIDERFLLVSILLPLIMSFAILVQFRRQFPRPATFYQYNDKEQAFHADTTYLSSKPGPVICSNILLCYAAGQAFVFDPFLVTEGMILGRFQENQILAQLEAGYYQVVQLDYPMPDEYRKGLPYTSVQRSEWGFTENFLHALGSHYSLTRETPIGAFYEPKK